MKKRHRQLQGTRILRVEINAMGGRMWRTGSERRRLSFREIYRTCTNVGTGTCCSRTRV